mgnify:CR=1 FL=1
MNARHIIVFLADCVLIGAAQASACPSCYGQAQGPVIDGMNRAIMTMIGITGFVLTGFVALFISIGRRAKQYNAAAATTASNTAVNFDKGAL